MSTRLDQRRHYTVRAWTVARIFPNQPQAKLCPHGAHGARSANFFTYYLTFDIYIYIACANPFTVRSGCMERKQKRARAKTLLLGMSPHVSEEVYVKIESAHVFLVEIGTPYCVRSRSRREPRLKSSEDLPARQDIIIVGVIILPVFMLNNG